MRRDWGSNVFESVDSKNNDFENAILFAKIAKSLRPMSKFLYVSYIGISRLGESSIYIKIQGFVNIGGHWKEFDAMIINPYNYIKTPGYSGQTQILNPKFILHFDGVDGSSVFTDECGSVWSKCGIYETISRSNAILGDAGLNLNLDPSFVLSGLGIKTTWPSGLSMAGVFSISLKFKCPNGFNNSNQLWLFCSTTMQPGDAVFGAFFDEVGLRWYAGIWGNDDTRITISPVSSFQVGSIYDLRFSRDPSGYLRAWVNGVQALNTQVTTDYTKPVGTEITIGTSVHDKSLRTPAGIIDEFAWWLASTPSGNFTPTNNKMVI